MILVSVSFSSKGDFENSLKWLNDVSKSVPKSLPSIAKAGVESLKNNTPVDTGATANGWKSTIEPTKTGYEISWTNDAHPQETANIAKLIELGYTTGTGGYVAPTPYIKQAMDPVFTSGIDKLTRELIK